MSGLNKSAYVLALTLLIVTLAACSDDPTATGPGEDAGWDIGPGADTTEADGASEPIAAEHPDNDSVVILVDQREVQLTNGASEAIEFEVPANAVSVSIAVDGLRSESYGLKFWTGPDDFAFVPEGWDANGGQICFRNCNNRIAGSEGAFAAIAPNNPDSILEAGAHRFAVSGMRIQGFSGTPSNALVKVTVLAKLRAALPESGVLDLNIHFTGSNGWTAASAQSNPDFAALLASVDTIYQTVGLRLGRVTYRDIDEDFQVLESITGEGSDLMAMFSLSESNAMNAVNLFFVEEINSPPPLAGKILGIAGGVPGPPLLQGTARSGVAVGTSPQEGAPAIANIVAHEIGHFLGLFHTTEHFSIPNYSPAHDPLPDTPNADTSYLMHAGGAGTTLSPWQGRVMLSNPWVSHTENTP